MVNEHGPCDRAHWEAGRKTERDQLLEDVQLARAVLEDLPPAEEAAARRPAALEQLDLKARACEQERGR